MTDDRYLYTYEDVLNERRRVKEQAVACWECQRTFNLLEVRIGGDGNLICNDWRCRFGHLMMTGRFSKRM